MKPEGFYLNVAKDIAAGLLVAAIIILVFFAGLLLAAYETEPLRDFRASIESEVILPDQHIFPQNEP